LVSPDGVAPSWISEIVNYLGQVTSEVKWDNFRFVARETMFVNKQMYAEILFYDIILNVTSR